jgi:excisionase family DNA binding protein
MNESIEIQKLTKAITNLTTALVEVVTSKVHTAATSAGEVTVRHTAQPITNLMTKKEVASYLKVSMRTVYGLMSKQRLPYLRLGPRCVRFMLSDVEEELKRRSRIGSPYLI